MSACLLLFSSGVKGLANITIDDSDPKIHYSGSWEPDSQHISHLDYGGSHTVSSDPNGFATFTFTGVAVYYLSPLWPYPVNTSLGLDDAYPVVLDLMDKTVTPTEGGAETTQSQVVYAFTGLPNTQHTLTVTMDTSGGQYIIMDGLIYTVIDNSTSVQSTSPPAISPTLTQSDSSRKIVVIAASVGAVAIVLIALVVAFIIWQRKGRQRCHHIHNLLDTDTIRSYSPSPMTCQLGGPNCVPSSSSATQPTYHDVDSPISAIHPEVGSDTQYHRVFPYPAVLSTSAPTKSPLPLPALSGFSGSQYERDPSESLERPHLDKDDHSQNSNRLTYTREGELVIHAAPPAYSLHL
ncbi:hypothetical protein BD410DRAFT_843451 [Rickenella mellea]|uniref:Mid2 domain-containing protein n=1 Tax=Rickenella mellea TaxID=50990 RepID=A0A4Y7PQK4_9AGAM|nr:hypothetical protein BD410DRAFT_843451 [Rickenella mellea]